MIALGNPYGTSTAISPWKSDDPPMQGHEHSLEGNNKQYDYRPWSAEEDAVVRAAAQLKTSLKRISVPGRSADAVRCRYSYYCGQFGTRYGRARYCCLRCRKRHTRCVTDAVAAPCVKCLKDGSPCIFPKGPQLTLPNRKGYQEVDRLVSNTTEQGDNAVESSDKRSPEMRPRSDQIPSGTPSCQQTLETGTIPHRNHEHGQVSQPDQLNLETEATSKVAAAKSNTSEDFEPFPLCDSSDPSQLASHGLKRKATFSTNKRGEYLLQASSSPIKMRGSVESIILNLEL